MTDDDGVDFKMTVEPEPSDEELVAIFLATRSTIAESESAPIPRSKWSEIARRTQVRLPLDERRTGWKR